MASHVLSAAALRVALVAGASAAILGCPHDWSSFDGVPREARGVGDASDLTAEARDASVEASSADTATFATMSERPTALAADATGIVLLTTEGSVLTCSHEGCALPGTIASNQRDPRSLAIGYGFVAWTARGDNAVRRASRIPGRGPAEQATDENVVGAVALGPTKIYWSVDAPNDLIRGPGIRFCTAGVDCHLKRIDGFDGFAFGHVTALAIDGADAFWLGDNTLTGCRTAACDTELEKRVVLAKDPVLPSALAVDAEQIYFGSPLDGGSVRAVPRSALSGSGGGGARSIAKGLGTPAHLAVTASSVWFTDPAGTVSRAPRTGGAAVVVVSGLSDPSSIAAGGGWVYVACAGDGRILRWRQD